MANEKKDNNISNNNLAHISDLNILFNDIFDNISKNISTENKNNTDILKKIELDMDRALYKELEGITNYTGDEITKVLIKLYNQYDASSDIEKRNIEDIFKANNSDIMTFMQERYKNKQYIYDDISSVCSQLYELKEAVLTMRDSICTADDVSTGITRLIEFIGSNGDDTTRLLSIIETMEKELKLEHKIKNHIIPKTLEYGTYYVYTIPYSSILEKYHQKNINYKNKISSDNTVTEAFNDDEIENIYNEVINESIDYKSIKKSSIKSNLNSFYNKYDIINDEVPIPILEGTVSTIEPEFTQSSFEKAVKTADKLRKKSEINTSGIYEVEDTTRNDNDEFSNIKGCYIKLINPKHVVPLKIMNNTILGYYYLLDDSQSLLTNGPQLTNNMVPNFASVNTATAQQDLEKKMVGKVVDKLVKSFNSKMFEENTEFKQLIVDALLFNDLYKKNVKFIFIPAEYMTEFKIDEDDQGNGTSLLNDSLFYAKLYLALLLFKMHTIITKSNDTSIYYVKDSVVDKDISNKVQNVARAIKSRQMSINDLLNYNSTVSKIGANKNIFVPITKAGEKTIEFDAMAGQDVPLDNELMTFLRTNFINSTGIPSVMMSYLNEADYSRTLVMANAKLVSRVINYQRDFNNSLTEFYKKLALYSTDIPIEDIRRLEYSLVKPKSQAVNSNADLINNIETSINFMVEKMMGAESEMTDEDRIVKDIMTRELAMEMMPNLPWDRLKEISNNARIQAIAKTEEAKLIKSASGTHTDDMNNSF